MTNYLSLRAHKDYQYDEVNPPKDQYSLDTFTNPKFAFSRKSPCSILAVFPLKKGFHIKKNKVTTTRNEISKYQQVNQALVFLNVHFNPLLFHSLLFHSIAI